MDTDSYIYFWGVNPRKILTGGLLRSVLWGYGSHKDLPSLGKSLAGLHPSIQYCTPPPPHHHLPKFNLKADKRRQALNEDMFEGSLLRFFIACLKRRETDFTMSTFEFFLHFFLKFKPFDEIFSFQNVIANLSLCVASVCVCA